MDNSLDKVNVETLVAIIKSTLENPLLRETTNLAWFKEECSKAADEMIEHVNANYDPTDWADTYGVNGGAVSNESNGWLTNHCQTSVQNTTAGANGWPTIANTGTTNTYINTTLPTTTSSNAGLNAIYGTFNSGSSPIWKECAPTYGTSAYLPPIVFRVRDENSQEITMTLCPEETISTQEALKLMMMLASYREEPHLFSALAYVKANNLERHFKFKS